MSQFLQYSDVDNQIQDEMGNQAPSSTQVLRAVNAELRNLNTKYDINTFVRTIDIDVVTDGSVAYDMSSLVSDNDVKRIKSLLIDDDNQLLPELTKVEYESFMNDVKANANKNQYTTYYEDGKFYLRVSTTNFSDSTESFKMQYYTTNLGLDASNNFISEINGDTGDQILLPPTYLDLVSLGAQKRLFYQAIGESDETQLAIVRNRYTAELKSFGLDDLTKRINRKHNKIKLRKAW